MAELEKSRAEAVSELDQLRAQKAFIASEVISLKENLGKVTVLLADVTNFLQLIGAFL